MKNLLVSVFVMVMVGAGFAQQAKDGGVKSKLVGAWRLACSEDQGPSGKAVRTEETGMIIYTADGHMAVQIRQAKAAPAPANQPIQYVKDGYEAYYGTYEINEKDHTVTHHVKDALVQSLAGKDLTRVYQFSGNQLILKSARSDEHWTICWEHY